MIRTANKEDIPVLKDIWYENFLEHDSKESIDYYFENSFDLEHTFVLVEENEIVSILQLNQHDLWIDGKTEPVSYVVGVATRKKYQRKGYMRILLEYAIKYCKEELKQRLIILQAYNWEIYRSFGFKDKYYKSKFIFDRYFFDTYDKIELENVDSGKLLKIYNEYTHDLNGFMIRTADYYEKMIKMNKIDNVEYAIYKEAYITYRVEDNKLICPEVAFSNIHDLFSLIKTVKISNKCSSVILFSDIYNFPYYKFKKELFMMVLKLDNSLGAINKKLYISEWI